MIAACHILVGAAIATKTQNPALGLFFAFFSHFFLDFIPHREYRVNLRQKFWKVPLQDIFKITTDISLGVLIVLIIGKNTTLALMGGFAAILPDITDSLFYILPKNTLSQAYLDFHSQRIHSTKNKISPFWEILTQIITVAVSISFLLQ